MGAKQLTKGYMSIGRVVEILAKESPDLSISKVRYLEDEGLIEPKRTKGGYRRFSEGDVERLKLILKLQHERYLPLRVIKRELRKVSTGRVRASELVVEPGVAASTEAFVDDGRRMTLDEVVEATGMTTKEIKELEQFGLVKAGSGDKGPVYRPGSVKVMHVVRNMSKHGIEARHLKMYQSFAERESTLLGQIVAPVLRQKSEDAKGEAWHTLGELASLSGELRQALLDNNLKDTLD